MPLPVETPRKRVTTRPHHRAYALLGAALAVVLWHDGMAADAPVAALRAAMTERLSAMPDVARHKWNANSAIEDRAQESAVLAAAVDAGTPTGLDAEIVRRAVAAQIEAAKQVQFAVIDALKASNAGRIGDVPDLGAILRPQIAAATTAFIQTLAAALPALQQCETASALRSPPQVLAAYTNAWNTAADGVIAAAGGPNRAICPAK